MSPDLGAGLGLALASAAALNWGFYAQHGAVSGLPPLSLRRPLVSLRHLFTSRRWLLGFSTGLGGWALYVAALAFAPLSLVQAASAGGVGLLAVLVAAGGRGLRRRERAGAACAIVGLALLGASLVGRETHGEHVAATSVGIWVVGSLGVAALAAGPFAAFLSGGAGFGLAAGVLYAAGDVATKAATAAGAGRLALVPVVLACHGLAFVCLQLGFQRGGALETAGVATLLTNALPIAAGTAMFGESVPEGALGVFRVCSFAAAVFGAAMLAAPESVDEPELAPAG